jgi:predicted NBD/HSP70 family sugar kinase
MKVGLDVGGTKTDAVAIDDEGRVVASVRLATGWGADAVIRTVIEAVTALAAEPGVTEITSVGIGIPGQVDSDSGRVSHAVNLGVDELDLAASVAPLLGVPVRVENDVKAAAVGAYALHGAEGAMAYLNLGTGIAAGIVVDGELWRGSRGTAGEVGHISVDPNGPACRCGQYGCIEAFAGGGAVSKRWNRPGSLPIRDIFDAADAGDPIAVDLRAGIARGVAAAVRILVLTADVDAVVLGGGVTALGERLMGDVAAELAASAAASAFMRSLQLGERVELLPTGSHAAAIGAALVGAMVVTDTADTEGALTHG